MEKMINFHTDVKGAHFAVCKIGMRFNPITNGLSVTKMFIRCEVPLMFFFGVAGASSYCVQKQRSRSGAS